jgi:acetyltransferase-like isoleucine patch superfamily enzyme
MSIISKNIRVRYPEHFKVGNNSIVDDFSYFSTRVEIGDFTHIASRCTIGGGKARLFRIGNYCSISSGAAIWCSSDDFVNDVVTVLPEWLEEDGPIKENFVTGDVIFEDFTAVGANSVVLPRNHIPQGTTIGAMSLVPVAFSFEPWSVYAGIPIRRIRDRNREAVLRQIEKIKERTRARGPVE